MIVLDPLLPDDVADAMVRLWHDVGDFGQYANEGFDTQFAPGLAQRYDAAANFVRTGGRFGRREDVRLAAARTNYFRETYAYGDEVRVPGIEPLLHHDGFVAAARAIHGRPVVVPAIVYANLLLPGQELAVHTDVPEYRGANRTVVPQWLLVVMLHSGLFEAWRMPIATGIAYFGSAAGGELCFYDGDAVDVLAPRHNTAAVLDTDSVFHGVDRVAGDDSFLGSLRIGMRLRHVGGGEWWVDDVGPFTTDQLRYSVSWKGYCFSSVDEQEAWSSHADDLSLDVILSTLADDLGGRPDDDEAFARLLIDRYVRFPGVASGR